MTPARASLLAAGSTLALGVTLGLTSARRAELLEMASLGLVLGHGLLFVVAAAYGLGQWSRWRWTGLAPVALLAAGLPLVSLVRDYDRARTDAKFARHFQAFEAAVHGLALPPGEVARPRPADLPRNELCCYRALVRRSDSNALSAVFMVSPRLGYLYDPSGTAWTEGVRARWRERHPLGPAWYRLIR